MNLTKSEFAAIQRPRPGTRKAAPPSKGKLEREVVTLVCDWLKPRKYEPIKMHAGTAQFGKSFVRLGRRGRPDYYMAHPDKAGFWCEFKREKGGKLSDAQIAYHAELRAKGFKVSVPNTLDEFIEWYSEEIEPKEQFSIARKRGRTL